MGKLMREQMPQNYWNSMENQHQFVEDVACVLGINTFDAWQHMDHQEIKNLGGATLLGNIQYLFQLLTTLFPQYRWDPYSQTTVPRNIWNIPEYQWHFATMLQDQFNILNKKKIGIAFLIDN